jgi:hypothetical protein
MLLTSICANASVDTERRASSLMVMIFWQAIFSYRVKPESPQVEILTVQCVRVDYNASPEWLFWAQRAGLSQDWECRG